MQAATIHEAPFVLKRHDGMELLRDGKGVYGLIGPAQPYFDDDERDLYLTRPDRVGDIKDTGWPRRSSFLQRVTYSCVFQGSYEYKLIGSLLRHLCWDAGLDIRHRLNFRHSQVRRTFHGLRASSYQIGNALIGEALAAADQEALVLARRFPMHERGRVYNRICRSKRFCQLAQAFPYLALTLIRREGANVNEATAMVERGAKLRDIADAVGLPMAMRKIAASVTFAADGTADIFRDDPHLLHSHMPRSQPLARRWFWAIQEANRVGGPLVPWVARHALELAERGESPSWATADIADWVRACYLRDVPEHILKAATNSRNSDLPDFGRTFITRPFSPDMSLRTVLDLSEQWDEAIAGSKYGGSDLQFPGPWCEGETIGDLTIEPIATVAQLHREAARLHNCASIYGRDVAEGTRFFFRVTTDDTTVAMVELCREDDAAELGQVAGLFNAKVSSEVMEAVRRWFHTRPDFRLPNIQKPEGEIERGDRIQRFAAAYLYPWCLEHPARPPGDDTSWTG